MKIYEQTGECHQKQLRPMLGSFIYSFNL